MIVTDHYIKCNGHIVALSGIEHKPLKKALCKMPHAQGSRDPLCPDCATSFMRRWFRNSDPRMGLHGLSSDVLRVAVHHAGGRLLERCLEVAARQPWFYEEYRRYLDSTDRNEDIETADLWATSYTRCPYIWGEEDTDRFMMIEEYWLNDQPPPVAEILARAPLIAALLSDDPEAAGMVMESIEQMNGGLRTVFSKQNTDHLTTILSLAHKAVSHGAWFPNKATKATLLEEAEKGDQNPRVRIQLVHTLDALIPKWRSKVKRTV